MVHTGPAHAGFDRRRVDDPTYRTRRVDDPTYGLIETTSTPGEPCGGQ